MNHPQPVGAKPSDVAMLRAWRDMQDEVLHELQEGADVPDALIDSTARMVVLLRSWDPAKGLPAIDLSNA